MKTIEQYEAEIQQKKQLATHQLGIFQENLSEIGRVIGKDPSHIYEVVCTALDRIEQDHSEMINVNTSALESILDRLNVVLGVLEDAILSVEAIEQSTETEELSVKNFVDEKMEGLAENAESVLSETFETKESMFTSLVIGLVAFAGLKYVLRFGNLPSAAAAAAAIYLTMDNKK